jgi:hypothetical protein
MKYLYKEDCSFVHAPNSSEVLANSLDEMLGKDYSAAAFASLRSHLKSHAKENMTLKEIYALIKDLIPPDIGKAREIQTLYALLNCTRLSLLPPSDENIRQRRDKWVLRLAELGEVA